MYAFLKRIFEIITSFISIILLLPIFIIVSILIKLTSKGPVLFKQTRVGKNKKPFTIYKFRTMIVSAPSSVSTIDFIDAKSYITKLGSFLRKTSLDELPQLFNIFLGNMSIIGPRPCMLSETEIIKKRDHIKAFKIKPGLTGWAQVNGRDDVTIDEKIAYDAYYIKKKGLFLDIKIIFKTIISVLFLKNVNDGKK